LYGDSADFDFSPYFGTMDFVLVDGSHSYEYVLSDTDNALKLLKNGKGIILWHDYGHWDGVTKALNELYESSEVFRSLKHIDGTSLVCFKNP
ncbi:class I SAM-dependent methyltransferase, partial [Candidatus Poribacteria bacterium]|nr:class I SAM-dependent methyltransferase [Candidatus Poribacteria bacterium]